MHTYHVNYERNKSSDSYLKMVKTPRINNKSIHKIVEQQITQ